MLTAYIVRGTKTILWISLKTLTDTPFREPSPSCWHNESAYAEDHRNWLKTNFALDPLKEADDIIAPAQERYQAAFDEWKGQYLQW